MTTEQTQAFNTALDALVVYMQSVVDANLKDRGYNWKETVEVDNRLSPVYVRILLKHTQTMVHAFVRRADGAILYPAGYKAPFVAKGDKKRAPADQSPATVRGSIYDAGTWEKCIGPYGVRTIR